MEPSEVEYDKIQESADHPKPKELPGSGSTKDGRLDEFESLECLPDVAHIKEEVNDSDLEDDDLMSTPEDEDKMDYRM